MNGTAISARRPMPSRALPGGPGSGSISAGSAPRRRCTLGSSSAPRMKSMISAAGTCERLGLDVEAGAEERCQR